MLRVAVNAVSSASPIVLASNVVLPGSTVARRCRATGACDQSAESRLTPSVAPQLTLLPPWPAIMFSLVPAAR